MVNNLNDDAMECSPLTNESVKLFFTLKYFIVYFKWEIYDTVYKE